MPKARSFSLLCWLALIGTTTCTPLEKITLNELTPLVSLKKGACFGRCPVYELQVYTNGIATFRGERFTDKMGLWIRQLNDGEFRSLKDQLDKTNLWQYAPSYPSRIPDAPMITITQYEDDAQKTVSGKMNRPDPVLNLQDMLEKIAESKPEEWSVREAYDYGLPREAVLGDIYVQLRPNVYARNWIQQYARQDLRIVESLNSRSNYFLMHYNPQVVFPRELERFLSYDDDVLDYSFLPEK